MLQRYCFLHTCGAFFRCSTRNKIQSGPLLIAFVLKIKIAHFSHAAKKNKIEPFFIFNQTKFHSDQSIHKIFEHSVKKLNWRFLFPCWSKHAIILLSCEKFRFLLSIVIETSQLLLNCESNRLLSLLLKRIIFIKMSLRIMKVNFICKFDF